MGMWNNYVANMGMGNPRRQEWMWAPTTRSHDPRWGVTILEGLFDEAVAMNATATLAFSPRNSIAAAVAMAATASLSFVPAFLRAETFSVDASAALAFAAQVGTQYDEATSFDASASLAFASVHTKLAAVAMAAQAQFAADAQANFASTVSMASTASIAFDITANLVAAVEMAALALLELDTPTATELTFASLASLQMRGYVGLIPESIIFDGVAIAQARLRAQSVSAAHLDNIQLSSPSLLRVSLQET